MQKQNPIYKKKIGKKGVVQAVYPIVYGLVILGVLLGVAFLVLGSFATSSAVTGNANATAALNQVIASLATIPSTWLPIIVIVAIASLVIYLVTRGFGGLSGFGGGAR